MQTLGELIEFLDDPWVIVYFCLNAILIGVKLWLASKGMGVI